MVGSYLLDDDEEVHAFNRTMSRGQKDSKVHYPRFRKASGRSKCEPKQ